jgi:predicted RNA-binding Zn-ribbon protein involved in translation (DUF1610 family)
MKKVIEAIENMIAVEEAAHHCPDCGVGAFCVKHDKAFWNFWGQVKEHLSHKGRYCADCNTLINPGEWCCPKCGGCL